MLVVLRRFPFICSSIVFPSKSSSSGWSVYTSALAGETPCYKTSSLAVQFPNATLSASGASASTIDTGVFTLRYALAPQQTPALSLGAKIGVAVGSAAGGAFALLALSIFVRKRRARKRAQRDEANMPKPESGSMYQRGYLGDGGSQTGLSELPSPHGHQTIRPPTPPLPENWYAMPPPPARAGTPMELAGSTYINEHHPAYGVSPVTPNANGFHDVPGPPEELAGDDPVRRTVSRETVPPSTKGEVTGSSPLREESERVGDAG